MGEKNLTAFMKNLSAKIKYNEVSQASWGGTKSFKPKLSSTSSSLTNPSLDYLLNSAAKLDKEQKNKNQMLEEYRRKQEQPVIKYNEYGDPIVGDDGKPISFKFHNIPAPELDLDDIRFDFTNPNTGNIEQYDIPYSEINNITIAGLKQRLLSRNNDEQIDLKKVLKERKIDRTEWTDRINYLKQNREELLNRAILNETNQRQNEAVGDLYGSLKVVIDPNIFRRSLDTITQDINEAEDQLDNVLDEIDELNRRLEQLNNIKEGLQDAVEELFGQIENRKKENKLKLDAYYTELQNINSGKFNAEKMFDETDEEYLQRLERLADTPVDNNINFDLAKMEQKKTLRENLKELVRDDQIINQVVNELDPELIFEFNKIFELFKTIFLKKYGYDNKNIKYQDIIAEFVNYMRARENQQLVLRGEIRPSSNEYKFDGSTIVEFEDIYDPEQKFGVLGDQSSAFSAFNPMSSEVLLGPGKKINRQQPVIAQKVDNYTLKIKKVDPDTGAPYIGNEKTIYLRFKKKPFEVFNTQTNKTNTVKKNEILFSTSGDDGEFESIGKLSANAPIEKIMEIVDLDLPTVQKIFNITRGTKVDLVQKIISKLEESGISPSEYQSFFKGDDKHNRIIGEGLSHEKKDKKVKFGDVVIMPNKLFYDNILSISRPDGVKINGFKNRHVSDDFVVVVVKMLENKNDYQRELNNLSSSERVLLDNLLKIANLHKKVITGSGNESINKLKNELQILEGQIQAGNNNESLKKKLHDILHKLAYFKVISLTQANKHYKEYIKNFF